MSTKMAFARFRTGASGLLVALSTLGLVPCAHSQESRFVIFDAPGADLTPGDYNGTYPNGINNRGSITGAYQSADTVLHGFIRTPEGKFITFQAPGADTTPGSYNGTNPSSVNDLGAIAGSYYDAAGF